MTPMPSLRTIRPRLVLFAGLGIDADIFMRQRTLPVHLETPDWIEPQDNETVRHYAERFARTIDPDPARGPLYLGGLSFGGMVALEAARLLKPHAVFLISTGYSHRVLAPWIRPILAGAAISSTSFMRLGLQTTPLFLRIAGRPDRRERKLMLGLVPRVNLRVARWGAGAVLRWSYEGDLPCPVHQIHGAIDRIVPLRRVHPDQLVPNAGHAVNVTHAEEVNQFLLERMQL